MVDSIKNFNGKLIVTLINEIEDIDKAKMLKQELSLLENVNKVSVIFSANINTETTIAENTKWNINGIFRFYRRCIR